MALKSMLNLKQVSQNILLNNTKFRPGTPEQLVKKITDYLGESLSPPYETALDMGCGSGRSTVSGISVQVYLNVSGWPKLKATTRNPDTSSRSLQIVLTPYNLVSCSRKGSAEKIQCLDSSVPLVCAGQCAHWFSLPQFYSETSRVLMPGGLLAVYGYLLPAPHYKDKPISHCVEKLMLDKLKDFMPEQSKTLYIGKYSTPGFQSFLFNQEPLVRDETMHVTLHSTVSDLVSYIASTSTMQNFYLQKGEKEALGVLNDFQDSLLDQIGVQDDPDNIELNVDFNFILIMGRKPF
ncbi:putative methyltransferase DDB_G0268948 [Diaphorina citri]|uniref:Methyltransferase DDB_G0268948 n=1 Tax=Diaphorina citri TaxID=121845 RepID=A0A3Q0IIS4_DIACI|nr:putative methyltransferase DDB_G0268948 [Diaphorina citri]